jgi:hypothetical protein
VLTAHARQFHDCYQPHATLDPPTTGRIVSSFTIDSDGRAFALSASGMTDAISGCVLSVIRTIIFPRPVGGPVQITYPISFEAVRHDDDDARAVAAAQPALDACASRFDVHGRVVATLDTDPEGHLTTLALDRALDGTPFARCLHDALARVRFSATHTTDVSLTAPLDLR